MQDLSTQSTSALPLKTFPICGETSESIQGGLVFRVSREERDSIWDSFLDTISGTHFEQTSRWASVRSRHGWQPLRIIAWEGEKIVGGVQILTRRIGRLATIGYVSRGPTVVAGRSDIESLLVTEVGRIARTNWWLYCVFDYPYGSHTLAKEMLALGYIKHPMGIPPSGLLDATALLDLQPEEEALLNKMPTSVRRDIRRSERSGLTFGLGEASALGHFWELMLATCARRGSGPCPANKSYFDQLWSELGNDGRVRLFLVRCEDKIISAAFAFVQSDTIRVWKVGWSGAHPDKQPNRFMWWQIIRWAKSQGLRTLDFVWVDTEDAKRVGRGELSAQGFRDGTTYFKLGFGSTICFPPPVQSKFYNPLVRLGYRCGGGRLLASRLFQRAVSRYWSRASG